MEMIDFRDTQYWNRMDDEERANYVYLIRKWNQAWDELQFMMDGHEFGELTILDLAVIAQRAANDRIEYEKTLLVKYWRTNVRGPVIPQ